jgi:hypothetical protein
MLLIPEPRAGIWIEFEGGDPSRPISSGHWGVIVKLMDFKCLAILIPNPRERGFLVEQRGYVW